MDTQINLLKIIAKIKNIDPSEIKMDTNIVNELMIDSLDKAEICVEVRSKMKKNLNPQDIDLKTTISNLADKIDKSEIYTNNSKSSKVPLWPVKIYGRSVRKFFSRPISNFILFFYLKRKVIGEIPKGNQFIFVSNHRSNLDGFTIYNALPKYLQAKTFAGASSMHWTGDHPRKKIRGLIKSIVPMYWIHQDDFELTIRKTAFLINKGYSIIIFPEGGIKHIDSEKNKFAKGTARFIQEFKLPVVLGKMKGLEVVPEGKILPTPRRHPVTIEFEYVELNPYDSIENITEFLEKQFEGY